MCATKQRRRARDGQDGGTRNDLRAPLPLPIKSARRHDFPLRLPGPFRGDAAVVGVIVRLYAYVFPHFTARFDVCTLMRQAALRDPCRGGITLIPERESGRTHVTETPLPLLEHVGLVSALEELHRMNATD